MLSGRPSWLNEETVEAVEPGTDMPRLLFVLARSSECAKREPQPNHGSAEKRELPQREATGGFFRRKSGGKTGREPPRHEPWRASGGSHVAATIISAQNRKYRRIQNFNKNGMV